MISLQKVKRGKLTNVTEPMFSRYLFIRTTSIMQDLYLVRSTLCVIQLVCFALRQPKCPMIGSRQCACNRLFMKSLDAVFVQPDGETRAMLLINLLSKPHMVSYETANLLHTEFKNAGWLRLGS